jgi:hypothetical protein
MYAWRRYYGMLFFKLMKWTVGRSLLMWYIYPEVGLTCIIDVAEMRTEKYQYFAIILCVIKWHKQLIQFPGPSVLTDRSLSHVIWKASQICTRCPKGEGVGVSASSDFSLWRCPRPCFVLDISINVCIRDISSDKESPRSTRYCVFWLNNPLGQRSRNTSDAYQEERGGSSLWIDLLGRSHSAVSPWLTRWPLASSLCLTLYQCKVSMSLT